MAFVSATGHGVYGAYDRATHTYKWQNPPLAPGVRTCLELVCRVEPNTPPEQVIQNRVTIDSDKTPAFHGHRRRHRHRGDLPSAQSPQVRGPPEPTGDGSTLYARPGDQITYRIAFDNKDNDYAVSKIVIVDALPQQVQFVSATSDGLFGSYDRGTHTYTWIWPSLGPRGLPRWI